MSKRAGFSVQTPSLDPVVEMSFAEIAKLEGTAFPPVWRSLKTAFAKPRVIMTEYERD